MLFRGRRWTSSTVQEHKEQGDCSERDEEPDVGTTERGPLRDDLNVQERHFSEVEDGIPASIQGNEERDPPEDGVGDECRPSMMYTKDEEVNIPIEGWGETLKNLPMSLFGY